LAHSHPDFIAAVLGEFPELRGDIEESGGVIHDQVEEFAAFTQAAKGRGDLATYERCLKLVDSFFAQADADLAGALRFSYLEHLDFEGSRGPAAWQLMPPRLQAAWNQVAAENRRLMALPQKHAEPKQPRGMGMGTGMGRGVGKGKGKGKGRRDTPRRGRRR
jgi:hypothetical protein